MPLTSKLALTAHSWDAPQSHSWERVQTFRTCFKAAPDGAARPCVDAAASARTGRAASGRSPARLLVAAIEATRSYLRDDRGSAEAKVHDGAICDSHGPRPMDGTTDGL
jgi:hypothetical protein